MVRAEKENAALNWTFVYKLGFIFPCVLLFALLSGCIGDRGVRVTFENRTETTIWINLDGVPKDFTGAFQLDPKIENKGPVDAGKSRSFLYFSIPPDKELGEQAGNYVITALTSEKAAVYQRIFTWTELSNMGWTVVVETQTAPIGRYGSTGR